VTVINEKPDGSFPSRGSEPTEENTKPLAKCVVDSGAVIGLAHDGDADRVVAVDEKGNFTGGDALLPLLCKLEGKSKVVVPINASMAVEKSVGKVQVIRCRVGDVYVSEKIKETDADFGGEPSGTWVFPKVSYCPDGIYAAARLVQIASEKPLSERVAELPRFITVRKRLDMPPDKRERAMSHVSETLKALKPLETSDTDGIRAVFRDGWMLFRPSGTEPKLKIVVEAESRECADRLLETALRIGTEALQ
jgi:phosphoglucosamine mutase